MGTDGFVKEAIDPVLTSSIVGALIGLGLSRNRGAARQIGAGIIGATAGGSIAEGVRGAIKTPNYEGLTPGELAVVREEARTLIKDRRGHRLSGLLGGVGAAMASGDPAVLSVAIPRATIYPYGPEVERLDRMADRFRAARRVEK